MWFDHLRQIRKNRKRGAAKAAETRHQKRIQANMADLNVETTTSSSTRRQKQKAANTADTETTLCGVCTEEYEETEEPEDWISCDMCLGWFHFQCVHVDPGSIPDRFICEGCTGIQ